MWCNIFATLPGASLDQKNIKLGNQQGINALAGQNTVGIPMLTNFCRMKGLASWQVTAMDADVSLELVTARISRIPVCPTLCDDMRCVYMEVGLRLFFLPLCLKQAAQCGMQG